MVGIMVYFVQGFFHNPTEMAGNRGLTKLYESYTRRADTGVNDSADAAELAAARVARKQTNKGRALEDLCKALLPLLSDVLPMLHLRMTRRLPLLTKTPASLQIAEETDDATDQIYGVWTQIGCSSNGVFSKLCRGSMLRNVNAVQPRKQD